MNKKFKLIALLLTLGVSIISCTKDDSVDNSLPDINESSLSGNYKITKAVVSTAVDTDNDGNSSQNLLLEGYDKCSFDNRIEISNNNYSIIKEGTSCSTEEKNEIYKYEYNTSLKSIVLLENGKIVSTFNNIYLLMIDQIPRIQFDKFDPILNQTVYYQLTKID